MSLRQTVRLSAVFTGLFIVKSSFASGFQINEMSPTIQATALADAATASGDISGMAYNPATLATIKSTDLYLGGTLLVPHVSYNNAQASLTALPTDIIFPVPAKTVPINGINSEGNITPSAFVPDAYVGTSLFPKLFNNNLKIGLGIDVPFGLETNYNDDWVGQYNALESKIDVINVFPTIAYQITPKLSAGASLNFENISATLSNNYIEESNTLLGPIVGATGNSSLSGSAWSVGYTLGLMYQLTSTTTVGADYHSAVNESINGTATITSAGGLEDEAGTYNGHVDLDLPAIANFGVSQKMGDKLTVMAGAEWTQWDTVQSINANLANFDGQSSVLDSNPLNYSNSWLYSLGAKYQLLSKLSVSGGWAYDATPTNSTYRDARIPDTNRQWLTLGCEYAPTKALSVFATYEHIFMNNQNINLTQQPMSDLSPVHLSANYNGYANIIAGGLNYTF